MRALAVLLVLSTALPARADDGRRRAREIYKEGVRLYDLGRFDDAIAQYETAYRLSDDPALLFNIGQAHRLARHWERAMFFYRSYLHRAPAAANRDEVKLRIAEMQEKLDHEAAAKDAAAKDAAKPTPTPPPAIVEPAPAATVTKAPPARGDEGRAARIAGFVLLPLGVAVVGGGIGASLVARADGNSITATAAQGGVYDPSKSSGGKLADGLGIALECVGGAAVVAGVVALAVGEKAKHR
jgi:tetratricopeptide (TPR) repeat protein